MWGTKLAFNFESSLNMSTSMFRLPFWFQDEKKLTSQVSCSVEKIVPALHPMATIPALALLHRYRQIAVLQQCSYCALYLHDEMTDIGESCLPPYLLPPLLGSAVPLRHVITYCTQELSRIQHELETMIHNPQGWQYNA